MKGLIKVYVQVIVPKPKPRLGARRRVVLSKGLDGTETPSHIIISIPATDLLLARTGLRSAYMSKATLAIYYDLVKPSESTVRLGATLGPVLLPIPHSAFTRSEAMSRNWRGKSGDPSLIWG